MKHIIVIGGGPAGIEAARTAVLAGQKVTLISDAPVGGRAGWHSLLPSKVWLTAADTLGLMAETQELGIQTQNSTIDRQQVLARVKHVKAVWNQNQEAELAALGVELVMGLASFTDPDSVDLHNADGALLQTLQADAFIVTTGSVPRFPPKLKPDGRRVIAPRFASHLKNLPPSMVVIGAGPTGCEFAYLFNRVGVEVTWIVDEMGVLPQMYPDVGKALGLALVRQGVRMVQGQFADSIERTDAYITTVLQDGARYAAEMAFVAVGRLPDVERLNLAAAGVESIIGRIGVDGYGRCPTNHKIYCAGDVDGGWMVANKAMAQARIAAKHAANVSTAPYNPNSIVLATYTEPQAAQVGMVNFVDGVGRVRMPYSAALKTHLLPEGEGFVELTYRESDRRLLGGLAVGPHAADLLTAVALAIHLEADIDTLADMFPAHPTLSELAFIAARNA